jgi:hypothetical protein
MKTVIGIFVEVRLEAWKKLEVLRRKNILRNSVDHIWGFNIPFQQMAGEPAVDTVILSFQIPAEDKLRLQREAAERKMSVSAFARFIIAEGVKDVSLSPEDYEEIAKIVRENQRKRNAKRVA